MSQVFDRIRWMGCLGLIVLLSGSAALAAAPADELVIVKDGKAAATIVIAAEPTENARAAADELQEYVERISGARLPVVADDSSPGEGALILVGRSRLTDAIPDLEIPSSRTKNLADEGFVLRTHGRRLVLAGNDQPPFFGTRYAVVEFLRRLGVRWFMPGKIGEVVPRQATLSVGPLNETQRPDFVMRNFWEHARGSMARECREWKIHNFLNPDCGDYFGIPSDGSVRNFLPEDQVKSHPDWFALNRDGSRNKHHPCTTSEEMIDHFVKVVKQAARRGKKVTAIAPEDGNPRCWCDRCAKITNAFDGFGSNPRDPLVEASSSNEWFYFINRVLTEVNKEYPDHIIATNGYANRDIPPEMPPEIDFNPNRNLTIMFANIVACTIHAYDDPRCWQMHRQADMLKGWCKLSDKVWVYNYNYTMLVSKGTLTPMVQRVRRNLPLLKQWGILGFHDQDEADWAMSGITTRIVRAALQWNTKADVDAILDDFFSKWFIESAEPMKAYYAALEAAFENAPQHGHEDVILPAIYTDELMRTLDGHIRAAEAAARNETVKFRLGIERLIYDHLCTYVAMEKAKAAGQWADAARDAGRLLELQAAMNKITPFMGWHPYPAYDAAWEQKRLRKIAALTDGSQGRLLTLLPEVAHFRLDPHDDGRYARWQEAPIDDDYRPLKTTLGWDTQGHHDAAGHPYVGVAWYQFEVDIPEGATDLPVMFYAPAVVNEAWLWVNGQYAGRRPYKMQWFRPQQMELEITRLLKPGTKNRIALRVLCNADVWGANGVYERMFLYQRTGKPREDDKN